VITNRQVSECSSFEMHVLPDGGRLLEHSGERLVVGSRNPDFGQPQLQPAASADGF